MANGYTDSKWENNPNGVASRSFVSQRGRSNPSLVRIDNKPFESPRERGRGNPGWGRLNNMPFVSQRGRRRTIPLVARSEEPDTASGNSYENIMYVDTTSEIFDTEEEHFEQDNQDVRRIEPFLSQRGRSNPSLVRIDNKPFESPRGRNPACGRLNNRPFVSQRGGGRVSHQQGQSEYFASAPSYENIMDIE